MSRRRGAVNTHVLLAREALATVARELLDTGSAAVAAALGHLGFDHERQLAAAIRDRQFDQRAEDVTACLRTLVRHRVALVHPGYDND